jgi:hypothetical protein
VERVREGCDSEDENKFDFPFLSFTLLLKHTSSAGKNQLKLF